MESHGSSRGFVAEHERISERVSTIAHCHDSEIRAVAIAMELGNIANNLGLAANAITSPDFNPRLRLASDLFKLTLIDTRTTSLFIDNWDRRDARQLFNFTSAEVAQFLCDIGDVGQDVSTPVSRIQLSSWLLQRFFDSSPTKLDVENLMNQLPGDIKTFAQPIVWVWEETSNIISPAKLEEIISNQTALERLSKYEDPALTRISKSSSPVDYVFSEKYPRSTIDLIKDFEVHKFFMENTSNYWENLQGQDFIAAVTTMVAIFERHLEYPGVLHPDAVPDLVTQEVEQILSALYDKLRGDYPAKELYVDSGLRRLMEFKRRQVSTASSRPEFEERYRQYVDSLPPSFKETAVDRDDLLADFRRYNLITRGLGHAKSVLERHGFDPSLASVSGFEHVEFIASGAYIEFGSCEELQKGISGLLDFNQDNDDVLADDDVGGAVSVIQMLNSIRNWEMSDVKEQNECPWSADFTTPYAVKRQNRIVVDHCNGKFRLKIDGPNSYVLLADIAQEQCQDVQYEDNSVGLVYMPHLLDAEKLIENIYAAPEAEIGMPAKDDSTIKIIEVELPSFSLNELYRNVSSIFLDQKLDWDEFGAQVMDTSGRPSTVGSLAIPTRGIKQFREITGRAIPLVDVHYSGNHEGVITSIEMDIPEVIFQLNGATQQVTEVVAALGAIRYYSKLNDQFPNDSVRLVGSRIRYNLSDRKAA